MIRAYCRGIGRVLVAQLALHGGDIAGLRHDVAADGMAGGMGGAVLHLGKLTDLVPDGVDGLGSQTPAALGLTGSRQEQGGALRPDVGVRPPFVFEVIGGIMNFV